MSINAEPLFFSSIFKERIWGGSSLASALNKKLPDGKLIGESWELCGFGSEQSCITNGIYKGKCLEEFYNATRQSLFNCCQGASFPILLKFIDAAENLSVQIHPDQDYAIKHGLGWCGKTECWYVLDAVKGAQLVIGFKNRVTTDDIRYAIKNGSLKEILNFVDIKPGEVYFIPAGTVHAILGGSLIYEVQEPSDVTFRLYDWERKDHSGKYRELHIEESVQIADLSPHNYRIEPIQIHQNNYLHSYRIACRYFAIEEFVITGTTKFKLPSKKHMNILTGLNGTAILHYYGGEVKLNKGQTVLLPSVLADLEISAEEFTSFVCVSIPDLKSEIIDPLIRNDISPSIVKRLGGFDEKNDLLPFIF